MPLIANYNSNNIDEGNSLIKGSIDYNSEVNHIRKFTDDLSKVIFETESDSNYFSLSFGNTSNYNFFLKTNKENYISNGQYNLQLNNEFNWTEKIVITDDTKITLPETPNELQINNLDVDINNSDPSILNLDYDLTLKNGQFVVGYNQNEFTGEIISKNNETVSEFKSTGNNGRHTISMEGNPTGKYSLVLETKVDGQILTADVFCKIKMQRIAMKNTECCHPIFLLFSRQRVGQTEALPRIRNNVGMVNQTIN